MRMHLFITLLLLTGCAHAPKYAWENAALDAPTADRRRNIDTAECQAAAMANVPLPSLPTSVVPVIAQPSQYNVNGVVNGQSYNATVTPVSSYDPAADLQAGQAYAEGLNRDSRLFAQYDAAVKVQAQFGEACMMRRGWNKIILSQR
jgi:hypothetical protein